MIKIILTQIGVLIMLAGCSGNTMEHYKGTKPEVSIEDFFNGPIKGWGVVQNWKGQVVTRFDVDMIGTWRDGTGTLVETFNYYDGRIQERIWTITKNDDGTYKGRADDILDHADGKVEGSAVNWKYRMDLPVGGKTYRLTFDDWMWQMNDGIVINRSYLKKFGITVAELTFFMQRQPEE